MSIDRPFTSLRSASAALILLACWSPSISDAAGGVVPAHVAESRRLMPGVWGGDHVRMEIAGERASLEFDCATGTIGQPIVLDGSGRFSAKGSYAPEHGPRRERETSTSAVYAGRVSGETMTLTITLEAGAQRVGRFTLTRDREPLLTKCR
jgi:hypothetical protein